MPGRRALTWRAYLGAAGAWSFVIGWCVGHKKQDGGKSSERLGF